MIGFLAIVLIVIWPPMPLLWMEMKIDLALDYNDQAQTIATELRNTRQGIRYALDDFDARGGNTDGTSTWILLTSSQRQYVESELQKIADGADPPERRVEANWILWNRTGDSVHLKHLFPLVKQPGGQVVFAGRRYLAIAFSTEDAKAKVLVPKEQPILIDQKEFDKLVSDSNNLFWPGASSNPK